MNFSNSLVRVRQKILTMAVVSMAVVLVGCKSEVYQGLTETQANAMMSVLLKNGIVPEKASTKEGYTLSVENDKIAQTLELMREANLPRSDYENMGQIFSAKGMISSATEEQARMTYALSQELSETFSQIDGVLTSRVHVVLGKEDLASGKSTPASSAVFLRHTPESQAPNLVPRIRELCANAVPGLDQANVSVMLVPVRETISVPMAADPAVEVKSRNMMTIAGIVFALSIVLAAAGAVLFMKSRKNSAAHAPKTAE